MNNSFSIIMPVYAAKGDQYENRYRTVKRAISSIKNQQYDEWELLVVNDGSDEEFSDYLYHLCSNDKKIGIINQEHSNRAIARNRGMDEAKNDWICWLDSDDEYSSFYLKEVNQAINDFPEYKIFNVGSLIYFADHKSIVRHAFEPKIDGDGHEWFRSGGINTGGFVFNRKLWKNNQDKYRIPDEASPYEFAARSGFDMRLTPKDWAYDKVDNPDGAFTDGCLRVGYSLGNPWGDDFLQFYKLTRDNYSKPLDIALYIQYPRNSEKEDL